MTTEDTRLVGAGRLCVQAPAEWPYWGSHEIDRSSVLVQQTTAMFAVGRLKPHRPPEDAVLISVTPESRRTSSRRAVSPSHRGTVAGRDASISWHEDRGLRRWGLQVTVWDLYASVHVEGPRQVCEQLLASVRPIDEGMVAVPNVWLDHHEQGFGSSNESPRDEDYLRALIGRDGLVPRFVGPPIDRSRLWPKTHVTGCDPYPTSVVPVGSTVVVTVEPFVD